MRFLVRLTVLGASKDQVLAAVRALARYVGAEARNPKWTSHGALELDIFCPTRADFEVFLSVIHPVAKVEFSRDLNVAPPHKEEEELFLEARDYFNDERYWECHEVLEAIWRLKHDEEKRYLQGLILVCAAFVHHQKGEREVSLSVLRRALKQLDWKERSYHGIDVQALRRQCEEIVTEDMFLNFTI